MVSNHQINTRNICVLCLALLSFTSAQLCIDEPGWATYDPNGLFSNVGCDEIAHRPGKLCFFFSDYPSEAGLTTYDACCSCKELMPSQSPTSVLSEPPTAGPTTDRITVAPTQAPSTCQDDEEWRPPPPAKPCGCEVVVPDLCDMYHDAAKAAGTESPYVACCACKYTSKEPSEVPSVLPSSSLRRKRK